MHSTIPDLESGRSPGKVRVRWEIYFPKESGTAEFRIPIPPSLPESSEVS